MNPQSAAPETLDQQVIALIVKHQGLRPGQVTLDSTFVGLGVDSVDRMDLLLQFEQVFQVPIPDDIDRDVRTVRDAVVAVRQALAAPASVA
jgi:acyl carrier protein